MKRKIGIVTQCKEVNCKMVKPKINIQEEECLAEEVRKYACLYDKTSKFYKDKNRKINAWRKVEEALGFEEGNFKSFIFIIIMRLCCDEDSKFVFKCFILGTAAQQFDNLKKKYSRKRISFRKLARSGAGAKDMRNAKKDLDDYSFFFWLDDHTRARKTKSNLDDENSNSVETKYNSEEEDDNEEEGEDEEEEGEGMTIPEKEMDDFLSDMEDQVKPPISKKKFSKAKAEKPIKINTNTLMSAELDVMQNFSKVLKHGAATARNVKEDDEELFGKLIAAEIRKFPENTKFRIKHEIHDLIFNYRVKQYESASTLLTPLQSPTTPYGPPVSHNSSHQQSDKLGVWYDNLHSYMQ